jgi:hypothetical protein
MADSADQGAGGYARPPRPFDVKPGDWTCPNEGCKNHNFARRTHCFKCNTPKPAGIPDAPARDFGGYGGRGGAGAGAGAPRRPGFDMRPGDWQCTCGEHNFARRETCRRCEARKPTA